jgi:hypothetical protein
MVSNFAASPSRDVNQLLPVTLCSGTGEDVIVPATQPDVQTAVGKIQSTCAAMGYPSLPQPTISADTY